MAERDVLEVTNILPRILRHIDDASIHHAFHIDGCLRASGDPNDFTFIMNFPPNNTYNSVSCVSANVPLSFYMSRAGSNTFTLVEPGVGSYLITVPIGNYTRSNLKSMLQSLLNAAGAWTYVVTVPSSSQPDTGKYTFVVSGNTAQPQIIFPNTSLIWRLIGFNSESTNVFVADTLESRNVVRITSGAIDEVFIRSSICSTYDNNILCRISIDQPSFSVIKYSSEDVLGLAKQLSSRSNNTHRFVVTDVIGNKLDLNGLDIHMVLVIFDKDLFLSA